MLARAREARTVLEARREAAFACASSIAPTCGLDGCPACGAR